MLLKSFYLYALGCGLLPAPLAKGEFLCGWSLRWYLIYTAGLQGMLLLLLPFAFPRYTYQENYIGGDLVLEWTLNLTSLTRVTATISGGVMTWAQRKTLLKLGKEILSHCRKCRQLGNASGNTHLEKRMRGLLGQKLFVLNVTILVSGTFLFTIETDRSFRKMTMIVVQILQFSYVVIMTASLYVILLVLHWQGERVRLALSDLCLWLHHEDRNSLVLSENKARRTLIYLGNLFQLHSENKRLLRKVFQTFDIPIVFLLLKMFATNVNMVHRMVLFDKHSIQTSDYTKLLGQLIVITHFWNAVLLMNVVDDITRRSGSQMGYILREFSDLQLVNRDFHLQLELFSDHLRCNPATYKVCGLFAFNKQTSLVYFFYVLVQVSVLVQFDLKNN